MTTRASQVWLPVAGIVTAAWLFVALMSIELARVTSAAALGPGMSVFDTLFDQVTFSVGNICRPLTDSELANGGVWPWVRVTVMWLAMSIAMMLPTAVPLIATFSDFSFANRERVPRRNIAILIAGYLTVWLAFSIVAALLQIKLSQAVALDGGLVSRWPYLSAGFLIGAGLYQFSPIKSACLARCRNPFATFLGMWRDGPSGAWIMGMTQGLYCLGCCWALMMLAFVGGVMNLLWMAVAMLLMVLEKLPRFGERLTTPLGAALIAAGAYSGVAAFI
ncbi:MAG: DUF2182 domain-containing protein [Pseudomonadota bacterium]